MVSFTNTISYIALASLAASLAIPDGGRDDHKPYPTHKEKPHTTKVYHTTTKGKWETTTKKGKWPTTLSSKKKHTSTKGHKTSTKEHKYTKGHHKTSTKSYPSKPSHTGKPFPGKPGHGWGHHWNKTSMIITSEPGSTYSIPIEETTLSFDLTNTITGDASYTTPESTLTFGFTDTITADASYTTPESTLTFGFTDTISVDASSAAPVSTEIFSLSDTIGKGVTSESVSSTTMATSMITHYPKPPMGHPYKTQKGKSSEKKGSGWYTKH